MSEIHRVDTTAPAAGPSTLAVRGGRTPDPLTGSVTTPIYQTTTYAQDGVGRDRGHTYSRASNPTVSALEEALGAFENAPPAVAFGTGMGAITTLLLTVTGRGDHVIVSEVVYGGTVRFLREILARFGVEASFVDTSDARNVEAALRDNTRLVLAESPGNPTLVLADLHEIAAVTRNAGVLFAVDNTFLTAAICRPLDLGADVVVLSTTKFVDGHNATVGGALLARDETLLEQLRRVRKTTGTIQSPQNAWLTLQGLKTLPLRLREHSANAEAVARWLESHPSVRRVVYPGLPSFPQADLARRQHRQHHGGVLGFDVVGGTEAGIAVLENVRLCILAENLGAAETLITHPASMTHGDVPASQREAAGITDGWIRLSVGLENPGDIIHDLDRALDAAASITNRAAAGVGGGAR